MPRSPRSFLLVAALALAFPGARATAQESVCAPCDSTQRAELTRTLRGQLSEVQAELMRLLPELERVSADLAAGEPLNAARITLVVRENELRGIEHQLARALARLELQQRRISVERRDKQSPRVRPKRAAAPRPGQDGLVAPAGYIGVSFSGAIEPRPGARRFFFHDYPEIVAVDAGSPAERGGLQAGDVLVMLGDTELRENGVDLNVVLRPGAKVPVRYRRDGTIRSATIVVARPPTMFRVDPAAPFLLPHAEGDPLPAGVVAPAPAPSRTPPATPTPAVAPLPPIFTSGGMTGGVAGAEVARVQGNLREILGVDGGLLVLDVGMGTPASRSGLRSGDVILRADGRDVSAPIDLVRAVRDATGANVQLEIVRKKERRSVVLSW
jgi:S1-C subfamily serine protease